MTVPQRARSRTSPQPRGSPLAGVGNGQRSICFLAPTSSRVCCTALAQCLHHAVDDYSRVAYSEILNDERKETAAAFWIRANAFFASLGVTVTAVMTDNGSCYRSHTFAEALGTNIKHKWTRPYRPQTNGKVERFNRTLAAEWAYAKPYASETERTTAYKTWLHHYNHHRPHTGIDGQTPSDRVHNLTGKYP